MDLWDRGSHRQDGSRQHQQTNRSDSPLMSRFRQRFVKSTTPALRAQGRNRVKSLRRVQRTAIRVCQSSRSIRPINQAKSGYSRKFQVEPRLRPIGTFLSGDLK